MADAAVRTKPAGTTAEDPERELTDGFHLVIDALKLNGIPSARSSTCNRATT